MLEPKNDTDNAVILEFKVQDPEDEPDLSAAVRAALQQNEEKGYAEALTAKGLGFQQGNQRFIRKISKMVIFILVNHCCN